MNYTIAIVQDIHNNHVLTIDKSGSAYTVWLTNTDTNENAHKSFGTIEDAYAAFERLAHAIVTGCYSWADRKAVLA